MPPDEESYAGPDPSQSPLVDKSGNVLPRYRFLADFDGDGTEDVALSEDPGFGGRGGGLFFLYLQTEKEKYQGAGHFEARPDWDSLTIERVPDPPRPSFTRIGGYVRYGDQTTLLTYHEIKGNHLFPARWQEFLDDTDGRRLRSSGVKKVASCYSSYATFRLEQSTGTNGNGMAVWRLAPHSNLVPHPTDPSMEPVMTDGKFYSQCRMIADFDGNGLLDIGLTECEPFEDGGFTIYLRTHDGYKNVGLWKVSGRDSMSIEYENPPYFSRLWSSGHISSTESLIRYTELKNGVIVTNNTFPNCFELTWGQPEGDDQGNKLPNALSDAIFGNSSAPVWLEKSVFTNGVFEWVPIGE
jgi:hypothetical protein